MEWMLRCLQSSDERADTILRHLKQEGISTAWMGRDPPLRAPLFSFPHMTEMRVPTPARG